MKNLIARCKSLIGMEEGQDLAEYALLLALIAVGCIATITAIGTKIVNIFSNIEGVL
jgi:pilus assembly protein Flp/PilA